jgi:hypothetical protein
MAFSAQLSASGLGGYYPEYPGYVIPASVETDGLKAGKRFFLKKEAKLWHSGESPEMAITH